MRPRNSWFLTKNFFLTGQIHLLALNCQFIKGKKENSIYLFTSSIAEIFNVYKTNCYWNAPCDHFYLISVSTLKSRRWFKVQYTILFSCFSLTFLDIPSYSFLFQNMPSLLDHPSPSLSATLFSNEFFKSFPLFFF